MAKRVEESYGVHQLESRLRTSTGKSIIEEWQNSNDRYNGILRNDEFYEERAIDVGNDPISPSPASRKIVNSSHTTAKTLSASNTNGKKDFREDSSSRSIGTEKNPSTGTVRSIPIKDYRASLAQNMGTLRRSIAPQQQFETLVSETERHFRAPSNRRNRLNVTQQSEKTNKFHAVPARDNKSYAIDEFSRRSKSRRSNKSNREHFNDVAIEFLPSFRFLDEPKDFFVDSGVFMGRASTKRRSKRTTPVRDEAVQTSRNFDFEDNDNKRKNESVDLERGNVCKKISVYEENVRSGSGRSEKIVREAFNASKRRRAIGVPLVGMHNACGLPVIAHWPDNRVFETLQVPRRIVGSLRKIDHRVGTSERRNGTRTKRRAPQPSEIRNSQKFQESLVENEVKKIPESERTEESVGSTGRKRIIKRPSFKASRNVMPHRHRYSRRNVAKLGNQDGRKETMSRSFGKREATRRSIKRSTIYAKDEGNEAAEVLTNLCLNPLARKGAANMIW